jgi:NAD(P)-dependent dehydrogenase (short-subunit alcohol dehydrogenase family)
MAQYLTTRGRREAPVTNDLQGKVIIITGGSSGIGAAAARALRQRGATVAITGRSDGTRRLAEEIGADYFLADYKNLATVRKLAEDLLAKYPHIDVLVNNVGGMMNDRHLTADGYEATLQVNHLGGFLLTALLQDRLNASKATVINTSSIGNNLGNVRLDDLQSERNYSALATYGTGKLMNILHAAELQRRYGDAISAVSFHPGPVATGFAREADWATKLLYETPLKRLFLITPEQGADTLVWLATTRPGVDWTPGEYYAKRKPARRSRQSRDPELAKGLWEASERLVAPFLNR